jgi:hypothetical protein
VQSRVRAVAAIRGADTSLRSARMAFLGRGTLNATSDLIHAIFLFPRRPTSAGPDALGDTASGIVTGRFGAATASLPGHKQMATSWP